MVTVVTRPGTELGEREAARAAVVQLELQLGPTSQRPRKVGTRSSPSFTTRALPNSFPIWPVVNRVNA